MQKELSNSFSLDRGGYLVRAGETLIQIGCPPETIKDTLQCEKKIPSIFVLGNDYLCESSFKSLIEVEFPIYYNFFLLKKKITIICHKKNLKKIKESLSYCLSLRKEYDIKQDFGILKKNYFNCSKQEYSYFVDYQLEDVVQFLCYDEKKNKVSLDSGQGIIKINIEKEKIKINFKKQKWTIPNQISCNISNFFEKPKTPISFKNKIEVLCLGASDGFDELDKTSGFLFFFNGKLVLVDPPADSYFWLIRNGIDIRLIEGIILTHTHADHDSGIFKFLCSNNRINFYTTKSILESWLQKYSLTSNRTTKQLNDLFFFQEIKIGKKIKIGGESFSFHYSLHSIPTLGFRLFYQDHKKVKKTFFYSGDHLNSTEHYDNLLQGNYISKVRHKELNSFPWKEADVIFHECGVEPLHTGIQTFLKQPKKIQQKIHLYHISKKKYLQSKKKYKHSINRLTTGIATVLNSEKLQYKKKVLIPNLIKTLSLDKQFQNAFLKAEKFVLKKQNFKSLKDERFYFLADGMVLKKHGEQEILYRAGNWICFSSKDKFPFISKDVILYDFKDDFYSLLESFFQCFLQNQSWVFSFFKGSKEVINQSYVENYIFDFAMMLNLEKDFDFQKIKRDKDNIYFVSKNYLSKNINNASLEKTVKDNKNLKIVRTEQKINFFFSMKKSLFQKYSSFSPIVHYKYYQNY